MNININFTYNRHSNMTNSTDLVITTDYQYLFDSSVKNRTNSFI